VKIPFERWRPRADREVEEAKAALQQSRSELWRAMVQRNEASGTAGELRRLQDDKDALAAAVRQIFGGA
jgi:hypothetical protein